jgi:hypothetical protein
MGYRKCWMFVKVVSGGQGGRWEVDPRGVAVAMWLWDHLYCGWIKQNVGSVVTASCQTPGSSRVSVAVSPPPASRHVTNLGGTLPLAGSGPGRPDVRPSAVPGQTMSPNTWGRRPPMSFGRVAEMRNPQRRISRNTLLPSVGSDC